MKKILLLTEDRGFVEKFIKQRPTETYEVVVEDDISRGLIRLAVEVFSVFVLDATITSDSTTVMKRVQKINPRIVRLYLQQGCVTDVHDVRQKYHSKLVYSKAMHLDDLWVWVDKCVAFSERVHDAALVELMVALKHVPTVPRMYYKLSDMIVKEASMGAIAQEIEQDPAISANILKMANTAFYSAKTGSIRQAMMYIGLNNIKSIVLTTAVFGNDGLSPEAREIHWEHVRLTNEFLIALYEQLLGKRLDENLSAVGLLHDIGAIVLMSNFPEAYDAVVRCVQRNPALSFKSVEKKLVGFNHEQIGGYLLDLWGLPQPMVEVAMHHHTPLLEGLIDGELVSAVHLAHFASWQIMGIQKEEELLDKRVFAYLKIREADYFELVEKFKKSDGERSQIDNNLL